MTNDISGEAKAAIDAVLIACKKLKSNFGNVVVDKKKTKSAADVVTKLDLETEKFLFEDLKKRYPYIGFKGEETGSINISSGKFWLVDPIDGSAYFIRGVAGCTTILALIDGGIVKIGIIYDFVNNALYFAERGKGAYLNNNPIRVSDRNPEDSFISVECNINDEVLQQFLELKRRYDVIGAGYPSGSQHAMVACGQLEGRICLNAYGKDYDFAAGSLLIQEAGGVVANLGKTTYDYTDVNFLAANKKLFESLTSGENPIFPIKE
ncbi:MAG TPA: inositol monophosphatase [Patescibacteria group bacterium]|nr:inositol monophosphatase [Patescibacteria group bacterium]